MSKIEVNAIEPQCGTTLTVGASGDTITFPTGTTIVNNGTQTGFGRTGTVDWQTTPKTTSFTAESGDGYFVNTTSGAITVTLPAGSANAIVSLADYAATWQTNNVTVTPNGSDNIGGQNENATLDTRGQSVTFVYVDSTQGWINTMDSTSNVRGTAPFIIATVSGACNTLATAPCCANTKIATFTGPGTFCVSNAGTPAGSTTIDYLVVAGGGAGGTGASIPDSYGSGGGGAGGYRESSGAASGCYTASPLGACVSALPVSVQGYPITVGGGGTTQTYTGPSIPAPTSAMNGANSVFSTITAAGGGGAGTGYNLVDNSGRDGGAGGGGGGVNTTGTLGSGNTPPVSPPQGQNGGSGSSTGNTFAGGGGGAGGVGANGPQSGAGGAGGAGVATSITGSSVTRAGGGGGGSGYPGGAGTPSSGGSGGGGGGNGNSPSTGGVAGTTNTGGGGGGGGSQYDNSTAKSGANGGSGIVIIRYKFQ